jgi:hypothetical protein
VGETLLTAPLKRSQVKKLVKEEFLCANGKAVEGNTVKSII